MNPKFETTFTVAFSEVDSASIVYFARTFDFAHRALEEFTRSKNIFDLWFRNPEIAAPIVSAHCDYTKPLYLADKIQISLSIEKMSEHSASFKFQLSKNNELCANVLTSHCFIDKKSGIKISIPEPIRKSLNS
jgi:YbgC/YbaW family acyl-CoA thioester hydrolase